MGLGSTLDTTPDLVLFSSSTYSSLDYSKKSTSKVCTYQPEITKSHKTPTPITHLPHYSQFWHSLVHFCRWKLGVFYSRYFPTLWTSCRSRKKGSIYTARKPHRPHQCHRPASLRLTGGRAQFRCHQISSTYWKHILRANSSSSFTILPNGRSHISGRIISFGSKMQLTGLAFRFPALLTTYQSSPGALCHHPGKTQDLESHTPGCSASNSHFTKADHYPAYFRWRLQTQSNTSCLQSLKSEVFWPQAFNKSDTPEIQAGD